MPDLIRYQVSDGPHAGEPTTERGEIERLARECHVAACLGGLDSAVLETRFNVVRSSLPHRVATVRRLRDYLRPEDQRDPTGRAGVPLLPSLPWPRLCGPEDDSLGMAFFPEGGREHGARRAVGRHAAVRVGAAPTTCGRLSWPPSTAQPCRAHGVNTAHSVHSLQVIMVFTSFTLFTASRCSRCSHRSHDSRTEGQREQKV
jgi:hypothetical protein